MDRARLPLREPAPAPWMRPASHADEHAADLAARRVIAGGTFGTVGAPSATPAAAVAPPLARDVARQFGEPLPARLRGELAAATGLDLSGVRVHADARAARAAALVDARAYTIGSDIVFGAGEYAPHTPAGRELLLHELAHVAQHGCATAAAVHLHRKDKPAAPKGTKLQQALDSKDDNAVRDFVASTEWKTAVLEAWQAAWLITYLLDGFTGNDDEDAGLAILDNVDANNRLDLTLQALKQEGRWEQLFDDYHGRQYSLLLVQLSVGIQTLDVRAMFLDKFIDEWFVDEAEETALTKLLQLAPDAELSPLLDKKDRESELRSAIDNTEPRRGFERRVGRKNELNHGGAAKGATQAIVEQVNKSPHNRQRTTAEIAAILADAPKDLAAEAKGYMDQLAVELDKPSPDWGVVSKLHRQFTSAINTMEARKRAEAELELKYNVTFNYWPRPAGEKKPEKWGQVWTEADLREMDRLLQQLPPGILASSTSLRAFYRGTDQPWLGGQADQTDVTLFGPDGLVPDVLVHELGHTVAFTDGRKMQTAWDAHFKWEQPAAKDVPDAVKKKLDAYKDDELREKDSRVKDGDWYYRKNRYSGGYIRHPAAMCFVSDYAATAASDDFAETFMHYVRYGDALKKNCKDKYDFMHAEVFVKYFLEKQAEKALDEFDALRGKLLAATPIRVVVATNLQSGFVGPLRTSLETALTAKVTEQHTAATEGKLKTMPLAGDEATKIAPPFLKKLQALYDLAGPLATADREFEAAWDAYPFKAKAKLAGVVKVLGHDLRSRMITELAAQFPPLATRIVAGDVVPPSEMKGIDAAIKRYTAMAPRADPLIKEYAKQSAISDSPFQSQSAQDRASKKVDAIMDRILNPKPAPRGKVRRSPAADGREATAAPRPAELVPAGGRPLDAGTRATMEGAIGRDFSDVRVHDDAAAAEGADSLQADAYTVGRDIMFARGKHAPGTDEGNELLGHELAHVAQQDGAAPAAAGPANPADRRPAVLEERVTIPNTVPAEPAEDSAAPPPPATPGAERDTTQAAPVIALKPAPGAAVAHPDVVPPDHPSEREAATIGRMVARGGAGRVHASPGGVHRQPAPAAAPAQRVDIVFFMGSKDSKTNPFYKNARIYFKANVKTDLTVDHDRYRSLAGVFTYLRALDPATPVGHIYLVSHANEDGTLSFGIDSADRDAHTSYGELKAALTDRPELFALPFGLIDRHTVVHIKGCNIGRSGEMLNKLDEAFGGGRGLVTAPTHKQVYGTWTEGGETTSYEALSHYFLEYRGPVTKTRAEQLAEFKSRYPHIPEKRWAALLPKKGAKRDVVAFRFSYTNAADVAEALQKAEAYGQDNFTRPEMYVWRVASSKKTKNGVNVQLVAEKTNYTIARTIEDEERKRLVPDESDPEYFGKSTFYKTPTSPAELQLEPARMTTPQLLGRIAEIDAELATPDPLADEGRTKEAEYERGVTRDELGRRQLAVDVKVVKTEDWFGADEVYVKASRGGASITTKTHKLNDGQERTYAVPLLTFLPLDAPIRVEVFDEDWPDRDDLIVRMDWRPPFNPERNTESLDEADYRVQVRFER